MKRMLVIIMAAISLLAAISACTPAGAAPNMPRLTHRNLEVTIDELMQEKHITRTIELYRGDTLTLTLGANPTTGFSWNEQANISNATILEQVSYQFAGAAGGTPGAVGIPGRAVWNFKAQASGVSTISFQYGRPWEGGEQAEWTFLLTVTVK